MHTDRREFLGLTSMAVAGLALPEGAAAQGADPIIDIHQHVNYSGRPDAVLLAHQRALGVTTTILLPSGRPLKTPSTHDGVANGLQAEAFGNDACERFVRAHPRDYLMGANEVPDFKDAPAEIAKYLERGAVVIGEQKFGVDCDAPAMLRLYDLARDHGVPVLMHWQHGMYNHGFDRFSRVLEKYRDVNFIGHAQTWWGNIDKKHADQTVMYPKGPVTPGGLTDRYLTDYPNMYGDLSAGSGLNALTRDAAFARDFVARHQSKLLFGSDCNDREGGGPKCLGRDIIAMIRKLASREVERKLLYENARRVFRIKT